MSTVDARKAGVIQFDASEMTLNHRGGTALVELQKVINERPQVMKELAAYRKWVPVLIDFVKSQDALIKGQEKTFERYSMKQEENRHKRWSKEEDLVLIDEVCEGNASILELSTMMGRSPASIKTRLSYLVGIKRISQEVAGRFVGTLDGRDVAGNINGIITKGV